MYVKVFVNKGWLCLFLPGLVVYKLVQPNAAALVSSVARSYDFFPDILDICRFICEISQFWNIFNSFKFLNILWELQKIHPTTNSYVILCITPGRKSHFPKSRLFCRHIEELYDQSILSNHSIIIWKLYSEDFIGTDWKKEVIYFLQFRVLELCSLLLQS